MEGAFVSDAGPVASIRYTVQKGSFGQDVILTAPLNPADYSMPSNSLVQVLTEFYDAPSPRVRLAQPSTTPALGLTAAYARASASTSPASSSALADQTLRFGGVTFGPGRAYAQIGFSSAPGPRSVLSSSLGSQDSSTAARGTPTAKEFRAVGARQILFESVPYAAVRNMQASILGETTNRMAAIKRGRAARLFADLPPKLARLSRANKARALEPRKRAQIARITPRQPAGVVVDYEAGVDFAVGDGTQPVSLTSDTTWIVIGPVYCWNSVVIEGGTVIKYYKESSMSFYGPVTCMSSDYSPIVLTDVDDDTVGDYAYVGGRDPSGPSGRFYGNPAISWSAGGFASFHDIRVSYMNAAFSVEATCEFRNVQFLHCQQAVVSWGSHQDVRNCLFSDVGTSFSTDDTSDIDCQQSTFDPFGVPQCIFYGGDGGGVSFRNCVFTRADIVYDQYGNVNGVGIGGSNNGFWSCPGFGGQQYFCNDDNGPFVASDSGAYYLKSDSPFRGVGDSSVDPAMLSNMKCRTTQPPVSIPAFLDLTGEMMFSPQTPRYAGGAPDLGYHYAALDYTVAALFLDGGTLTVLPGTVVGFRTNVVDRYWFDSVTDIGINLLRRSTLVARGMPDRPIVFTDVQMVQENVSFPVLYDFVSDRWTGFLPDDPYTAPPSATFRFCDIHVAPACWTWFGGAPFTYTPAANLVLWDCNLYDGDYLFFPDASGVNAIPSSVLCVDDTFHRTWLGFYTWYAGQDPQAPPFFDIGLAFGNNLFNGGTVVLNPVPASLGPWIFKDNLFDQTEFCQDLTIAIDADYNAYWPEATLRYSDCATRLGPPGANDVTLSVPPRYARGPLGDFYLDAASELYNPSKRGTRSPADAGLYHYTTRVDQTKDGDQSGNVIIGRHYVASVGSSSCAASLTMTVTHDSTCGQLAFYVFDSAGHAVFDYTMLGTGESAQATVNASPGTTYYFQGQDNCYDFSLQFTPTAQSCAVTASWDGTVGYSESGDPLCATNPPEIARMPKDADGDGIPDYVENTAGDGTFHAGAETDWQNPTTDTDPSTNIPIPDSLNVLYDDVDLSGNGLVGRIKRALGIPPLEPSNPFSLSYLDFDAPWGIATFGLALDYDSLSTVGRLDLLVDGASTEFQEITRADDGTCRLSWNSTFDFPSLHHVAARFCLNQQSRRGSTPDPTITGAVGPGVLSDAGNLMQFLPVAAEYDANGAHLYARLPEPDASYAITLRASDGSEIRTISGTTSTGEIAENWDVTDSSGLPFDGESATAVFSVNLTGSGRSSTRNQALHHVDVAEVPDGLFTIAYAWDTASEAAVGGAMRTCIQWGIVDALLTPQPYGQYYLSTFNDFSSSVSPGIPGYLPNQAAVAPLLQNLSIISPTLTGVRNFHFDGHGSPTVIGNDLTNASKVAIDAADVAFALQNFRGIRTGLNRSHPYRFVFLDACKTANQHDWHHAFGIPATIPAFYLSVAPDQVQAFVGWEGSPRAPKGGEWYDELVTFQVFYGAWMLGFSLDDCLLFASGKKRLPSPWFDGVRLDFPLGIKFYPGQTWGLSNDFKWKVFGYPGIRRIGFDPSY